MVGTAIAMWVAGEAEKDLGHDAGPIVIDEAVGQSISLLFVPHTIVAFAISFVLFRIFDIWKPLGAREAQALPGGIGVVIDDVIAGSPRAPVHGRVGHSRVVTGGARVACDRFVARGALQSCRHADRDRHHRR